MLRLLLLRILPRRLVPILVVIEVVSLLRRWLSRRDRPEEPPPF